MDLKKTILRNTLPALLPHIPQALQQLEEGLKQHIDHLPLQTGEKRAALIIMKGADERIYIAETYYNETDTITRIENAQPAREYLSELIQKLIKN